MGDQRPQRWTAEPSCRRSGWGKSPRPPERLGLPEAAHVLAQLCFRTRQLAEVLSNDHPGRKADVGNLMLGRPTELSDKSLRGAYVVKIPEIFLQSLQPLH